MMKKLAISTLLITSGIISTNASAFWNNNDYNECWGRLHDCNPYDVWDPRYWFEEMEDAFDDNDHHYGYGYRPPYGYMPGYQMAPHGYMPHAPYYYGPGPHAPRAPWMAPAPGAKPMMPKMPPHQKPAAPAAKPKAKAPAAPAPQAAPQAAEPAATY